MSSRASSSWKELLPELDGCEFSPVEIGKSKSDVYSLSYLKGPGLFLKVSNGSYRADLVEEYERLVWLSGKVPVPEVVRFDYREDQALLLTRALSGMNAAEIAKRCWRIAAETLATELRKFHAIERSGCPFDRGVEAILAAARHRTEQDLVDESDFDEEHQGSRAQDLLVRLERERPRTEDLVVTHGDACLPNAIFHQDRFSGFVDCGKSGIADRYQDLAVASRSIERNYGPEFVEIFYSAYGITEIDEAKVSYYRLADEFF
jgi:aminoglycoside phosphotransferase